MRNLLFKSTLILLTSLAYCSVNAQVSIGLKGGVNFATLKEKSNDPDYDGINLKSKPGLNTGLLVNFRFGESPFSLQIEPGYSQRGGQLKTDESYTSSGVTNRNKMKLQVTANYIEMPVLLRFMPNLGPVEGILTLGPELRYLTQPMKMKIKWSSYENGSLIESSSSNDPVDWDENEDPGKTDFGIVAGLGVALPMEKFKVFAEGRYHYGFPLYNHSTTNFGSSTTYNYKLRNQGISVNLGILFPLGN